MLTGSGGWPMTVFLTPDGKPFFGGTYFRRSTASISQGSPGFWSPRPAPTAPTGRKSTGYRPIDPADGPHRPDARGDALLGVDILHQAYSALATNFDYQNGGVGNAPKFPQPMTLEVLLRYYAHDYNDRALEMLELTLEKMARGGIYDQVAGGFHRYSTDSFWLVPTSRRCSTTTPCWPACI